MRYEVISRAFHNGFSQVRDGVLHLVWPSVCLCCQEPVHDVQYGLCPECWRQLLVDACTPACPTCGGSASVYGLIDGRCPRCLGRPWFLDGVSRCGIYHGVMKDLILAFKHGHTELDRALGHLLNQALAGSRFLSELDCIVPVPLHWSRRLLRGFNQSAVMARACRPAKIPVIHTLKRIRRTRPQPVVENLKARSRNVAGAFALRGRRDLAGRTICLIDDIRTTGATLNECARVLREQGRVARVYALVLAVTECR